MRLVAVVPVSWVFAGMLACDGPCFRDAGLACSECEELTGPVSLEIGTGNARTGFTPLADGGEIRWIFGPGGGAAAILALRAHGIYSGEPRRCGDARDPEFVIEVASGDELLARTPRGYCGFSTSAGAAVLLEVFVIFIVDVSEYAGQPVNVRAEVADACGRRATAEVDGVLADWP